MATATYRRSIESNFLQESITDELDVIVPEKLLPGSDEATWPIHCVSGTAGQRLYSGLVSLVPIANYIRHSPFEKSGNKSSLLCCALLQVTHDADIEIVKVKFESAE